MTVGLGQDVTCTINNDDNVPALHLRKTVTNDNGGLELKEAWTLTATGTVVSPTNLSGSTPVNSTSGFKADTYLLAESGPSGYTPSAWSCVLTGTQTPVTVTTAHVTVGLGQDVTCTINNDDNAPKLTLVKVVENLDVGDALATDWTLTAAGGNSTLTGKTGEASITGATAVANLEYTLSEADGPTDYTASDWTCTGTGVKATSADKVTLDLDADVTCTITNTLKIGTIKVIKDFVGAPDTAKITLRIKQNGQTKLSGQKGDDGFIDGTFRTGPYTVDEASATLGDVDLGLYDQSIVCKNGQTEVASDLNGSSATFTLGAGDNIICTITNSRKPEVRVLKVTDPTTDNGKFDLRIGGAVFADEVGNGGDTGFQKVAVGSVTVDELAGSSSPTTLADYDSKVVCNSEKGSADPGTSKTFTVAYGDQVTCTITNSRKPEVRVLKVTDPTTDNGKFDLRIGGAVFADEVGNGGDTGFQKVAVGSVTVDELAGSSSPTTLADYDSKVVCNSEKGSADPGTSKTFTVAYGDQVTCTITNSKRPVVEVVKQLVPADDPGRFNLSIGGTTYDNGGPGFGDDQGTGLVDVDPGSITVAETGNGTTKASSYFNDVSCNSGKGGATGGDRSNRTYAFDVAYGDVVTCTFTNERKPSSIDVTKTPLPTSVNEPGGSVKYTVTVENTSASDAVTLTADSFVDKVNTNAPANSGAVAPITDLDCNGPEEGAEPADDGLPATLAVGSAPITCTFTMAVSGNAGDEVNDRITVTGTDESDRDVSDWAEATVEITDVPSTIQVTKTPSPASLPEPGGNVTYTVTVQNTSPADPVTLDVPDFVDKIGAADPATISDIDCNGGSAGSGLPTTLGVGSDPITCTFVRAASGIPGTVIHDVVTVTGTDDDGGRPSDSDDADVTITGTPSSIDVTKTANPITLDESLVGTAVIYTVVVKNTSAVDKVTLTAAGFVDKVKLNGDPASGAVVAITNLDCNGVGEGSGLSTELDPNETVTCTFSMIVSGDAGDQINDLITVTGTDDDGTPVSDSDDATVTITNVPSTITVTKTANPTVVQDSGPVTFTVVVRNNSAVDTVYIQSLTDSIYGNVNGKGTCTLEDDIAEGPSGSRRILPSASYTCSFVATVSKTETDVVTASGVDDDDQPVTDSDDATVTVNVTPPPPYVPRTDITVTKAATPQVQLPQGGGSASITYNLVVVNNGPDPAANVKVADTAPADVTFVSATTGAGSCTTTAKALDCTIASLAPGASVAITINATVNATGTKINVVIVTTTTPETNTNNNKAEANTLVIAPITPPTPKPKPEPEICDVLLVTPKMLKANGKKQTIVAKVTEGKKGVKGARIVLSGAGVSKTVKTNAQGIARITIRPSKPGIIKVEIRGTKACNTQRIGVVGVFEPPVTG